MGLPLPDWLHRYFWEHDPVRLVWPESRGTIALRLLQWGDADATRWLRERVSDAELRDFLARRRGRGLEPDRLRYWGQELGIPNEEVEGWIAALRENPWYKRTSG